MMFTFLVTRSKPRVCAAVIALLALLVGCAQGVSESPNNVVPTAQQLESYKTYMLDSPDANKVDAFISRAPDLPGRLRAALDVALQEQGLKPDSQQPDILVSVVAGVTHRAQDLMSWYGINSRTGLAERDLALEDGVLVFSLRLADASTNQEVGLVSLTRSGRLEQQDNGRLRSAVNALLKKLGW